MIGYGNSRLENAKAFILNADTADTALIGGVGALKLAIERGVTGTGQARRETGYASGKDCGRADHLILATGLINRALGGLDQRTGGDPRHRGMIFHSADPQPRGFRSSVTMWRGSYVVAIRF